MKISLKFALIIVFFSITTWSIAQTTEGPTQWGMQTIGGEDPYYVMPEGFSSKDSAYSKGAAFYLQAWFKDGKDKSNWKEQMLLKALPRAIFPPGNNADVIKELSINSLKKNCNKSLSYSEIEKIEEGKYGFSLVCGSLSGDSSVGLASYNVIVEGKNSMYSISREAKIESFDEPPSNLNDQLQQWKLHLSRTRICQKDVMCAH